jgi:hypothetical protein
MCANNNREKPVDAFLHIYEWIIKNNHSEQAVVRIQVVVGGPSEVIAEHNHPEMAVVRMQVVAGA